MSVLETALVFAGIPLAGFIVLATLIFGGSEMRSGRDRYRPGRPWTHQPVWYLPQAGGPVSGRTAIESASAASTTSAPATQAVGGASGEW